MYIYGHNVDIYNKFKTSFVSFLAKGWREPQRTVLKYFALFKNVAHSLEPGETPSNYVQRFLIIAKHGEITTKNPFTGTATKPQRNRIFRQFKKDQYCNTLHFL